MAHQGGGSPAKKRRKSDNEGGSAENVLEMEDNAEHEQEVLSAMRTILGRPELLDVAFVCEDGREVRANRAILASGSEYFSKLLYGDMKDRSMDRIPLPSAKADSLQIVVRYLHGHPFQWDTNGRWGDLVEAYCLASQYQVDSLLPKILCMMRRAGNAHELSDLLNTAIPRHPIRVQNVALTEMNKLFAFDSTSFKGWSKESIIFCLEKVRFHPQVTETMVAEAVLSAAFDNRSTEAQEGSRSADVASDVNDPLTAKESADTVAQEGSQSAHVASDVNDSLAAKVLSAAFDNRSTEAQEGSRSADVTSDVNDSRAAKESADTVASDAQNVVCCSDGERTLKNCDSGVRSSSLSRKDLREVLECHVNLAFVDPAFLKERIEPLGILRPEVLAAVYGVHAICFSRGMSTHSTLSIPWRSLHHRVSFAPVKPGQDGIQKIYSQVSIPAFWVYYPPDFIVSKELPQQVRCTCRGVSKTIQMNLPLRSGKHIWMVRSLAYCKDFGVGVACAGPSIRGRKKSFFLCPMEKEYFFETVPSGYLRSTLSPSFLSSSGIRTFASTPCDTKVTVFVILDVTKRTLTFADKLERYLGYRGEYPVVFEGVPCGGFFFPVYPAVWMTHPGCAEIGWIQSTQSLPFTCDQS
ncbi:hypothetical protein CBR_g20236 [Chara braunii]|uniref:BTB domain-containing protein n=1 Tax=Chara braunii TaxID=69332 RepID=A0A388KZX8_CHABU|nr:hypothetical protein CBR_g20236 [Chara braunii]|eukprot:GBG75605.1 hypothetical protein CBR_g20236 [Chara braunii]